MDAFSLDPEIHLDLTKEIKRPVVSKDQTCCKYLCPLLSIKLKQSLSLSSVVERGRGKGIVTIADKQL